MAVVQKRALIHAWLFCSIIGQVRKFRRAQISAKSQVEEASLAPEKSRKLRNWYKIYSGLSLAGGSSSTPHTLRRNTESGIMNELCGGGVPKPGYYLA